MRHWRQARVFISSTFRDMHGERDALTRTVFPELQERCNALRVRATPVDLRWGVTEDQATQALGLCLSEVDACRPFFVSMLGTRYGWCPQHPYDASAAAGGEGDADDQRRAAWLAAQPPGLSVTALEVLYGALRPPEDAQKRPTKTRACVCLRDPTFMAEVPAGVAAADFAAESSTARDSLERLKESIRSAKDANIALYDGYPCLYRGVVDGKPCVGGLEAFCSFVLEFLWSAIRDEFAADAAREDATAFDPLSAERELHMAFGEAHTRGFVGRKDLLRNIHASIHGSEPESKDGGCQLGCICAEPGAGKTSLMAVFAAECIASAASFGISHVIPHFVGGAPGSTDIRRTLSRICKELQRARKAPETEVPDDYSALKAMFSKLVGVDGGVQYPAGTRVVLVIDAINQLDPAHNSHSLDWLPTRTNPSVRVVVSTLRGKCFDVLQSSGVPYTTVGKLTRNEQQEIVTNILSEYCKRLDDRQMELLLKKKDADKPLFLAVATEELRVFGVFEQLTAFIRGMPDTVPELFQSVLKRLEGDHGAELVRNALCLIRRSRGGLQEIELLTMLGYAGRMESPIDGPLKQNLAQGTWARLRRSLRSYLSPTAAGEGGENILAFFHQQLAFAVDGRYFLRGSQALQLSDAVHRRMADYYAHIADPKQDGTWTGDAHGISELPFHLMHGRVWDRAHAVMTDLGFVEAKSARGMPFELVADYLSLTGEGDDETERGLAAEFTKRKEQQSARVREFASFVQSRVHVLAKKPYECFSLAANLPDSSAPASAARDRWTHGKETRPFLDWANKPQSPGSCVLTFVGHTLPCRSCHVCPKNDALAVSCGEDGLVKLFNTRTGEEKLALRGHKAAVTCVRILSDGSQIISGSLDRTVRVWAADTGSMLARLTGHKAGITFIALSPDEQRLCSASLDKTFRIWYVRAHASQEPAVGKGHMGGINGCDWSPDGKLLATASSDRTVRIWATDSWAASRATLVGHQKAVTACHFSPDGATLATASDDRSVRLWSMRTNHCIYTIDDAWDGVCGVFFTPDNQRLLSTSHDNVIRVYSTEKRELVRSLTGHTGTVFQAVSAGSASRIATCSFDRSVKIWNLQSPLGGESPGHSARVLGVAFHPRGEIAATASRDKTLKLWRVDGGAELKHLVGHASNVFSCSFSPNGEWILSASRDGSWRIWDVRTGECLQTALDPTAKGKLAGCLIGCCWAPDGSAFMTTSTAKLAHIWDARTFAPVCTLFGHHASVNGCDWAADGTFKLATVSEDKTGKLWDSRTRRKLATFSGHSACLNTCAFSPDGQRVLTGGDDNVVIEWDANRAKQLARIEGHTAAVTSVRYTRDGKALVTGSTDCSVVVWNSATKARMASHTCLSRITSVATSPVSSMLAMGDGSGGFYLMHPLGM